MWNWFLEINTKQLTKIIIKLKIGKISNNKIKINIKQNNLTKLKKLYKN